MKAKITAILFCLMIGIGVLADWKLGYEWAGNLAMFASWFFIILCLLIMAIPAEKFVINEGNRSLLVKILFFADIMIMVSVGWFVTAAFVILGWLILLVKKEMHIAWKAEQKGAIGEQAQ